MTAATALLLAVEALLAIVVAVRVLIAKSREQDAAITALLDRDWDQFHEQIRSETPIHDEFAVETFRRELSDESGWPL